MILVRAQVELARSSTIVIYCKLAVLYSHGDRIDHPERH